MAELASPLIAAGSGLLGTSVGGLIAWFVARQESKSVRQAQESEWTREDRQRHLNDYAELVGVAMKIMGSWSDLLLPRPMEEIRALDDERQRYYEDLHRLMAMVRISAPVDIADGAEAMMVQVKRAQMFVDTYVVAGKTGVDGGAQNVGWREIEESFVEARGLFTVRVRATLPP